MERFGGYRIIAICGGFAIGYEAEKQSRYKNQRQVERL